MGVGCWIRCREIVGDMASSSMRKSDTTESSVMMPSQCFRTSVFVGLIYLSVL